jgi:membrane associated rhomboid family serine protease
MYILGDRVKQDTSKARPYVLWVIVGLCVLVFIVQLILDRFPSGISGVSQGDYFTYMFGAIPARVANIQVLDLPNFAVPGWVTLFTSMFLHGDFWHILFNMWTLYVFGDNIEHALGKVGFALFYIAGGVVATLVHVVFSLKGPGLLQPTIGASGAIAAVMGVYMVLYPRSQVFVLALWFPIAMPSVVFMGIWFAMQILGVFNPNSNIAWWAHIGGFIFGVIVGLVVKQFSRKLLNPESWRTRRFLKHEPFGRNDGRTDETDENEEDIWRH